MAVGTTYRLSLVGRQEGSLHVNTYHFRQREDVPGEVPAQLVYTYWVATVQPDYLRLFHPNFELRQWNVYVAPNSPENWSVEGLVHGAFGQPYDPMPNQCSCVITWRSGIAGRRYRGRSYIGALNASDTYRNELTTEYIVRAQAFANSLVISMQEDSPFDFVVYSRAGNVTTKVNNYDVKRGIFTQRRRTQAYGL